MEATLAGKAGLSLRCVLLPAAPSGAETCAVVRVALASLRREPSVRAEQVSQEPLGAVLECLRLDGEWWLVRGADRYLGWAHGGSLLLWTPQEADSWRRRVEADGAVVLDGALAGEVGAPLARLPWGARVVLDEGGGVRLPDGRRGRFAAGTAAVPVRDLAGRFGAARQPIAATAMTWLGVPYQWGGRTRWGADCSGFVQAVFALHGVPLPRDSDLQAKSGTAVEAGKAFEAVAPADLLFFHAESSRRISHVGLALGGGRMVHAAEPNGEVAVDDLLASTGLGARLARRVATVRRVIAG